MDTNNKKSEQTLGDILGNIEKLQNKNDAPPKAAKKYKYKHYQATLKLLEDYELHQAKEYFNKKTKKDGFDILKEALWAAPLVSSLQIDLVIQHYQIQCFPERLKEINVPATDPIDAIFGNRATFPVLGNALSSTRKLLNTGPLNVSLLGTEIANEIWWAFGLDKPEEEKPIFTEMLAVARSKKRKVGTELTNRLHMLKQIKPWHKSLGWVLSGKINASKSKATRSVTYIPHHNVRKGLVNDLRTVISEIRDKTRFFHKDGNIKHTKVAKFAVEKDWFADKHGNNHEGLHSHIKRIYNIEMKEK